jgi:hypothetical protein
MSYEGPERRIHSVFLTRNREYHVRQGICVAVRDRKTGAWISKHKAIGMELEVNLPAKVFVGGPLLFLSRFSMVRTTRVVDFFRPERHTVDLYGLLRGLCPA